MDFDYTQYVYLPECTDGCGAITDWMHSGEIAREVGKNHGRMYGHGWQVRSRMKESKGNVVSFKKGPRERKRTGMFG